MSADQTFTKIAEALAADADDAKKQIIKIRAIIEGATRFTFKSIQDLMNYEFLVPDYQRGYKWTQQQVNDLLNDIWAFHQENPIKEPPSNSDDDPFYCLQPVVVKKEGEKWSVIDGQQRLTTIYLILKYLGKKPFEIDYTTRPESFDFLKIESIDDMLTSSKSNVDIYHFKEAITAINEWFSNKDDKCKKNWRNTLLYQTKVIWYQPDSEQSEHSQKDEIDIFARINSGKIPLTNSELIRALFIHNSVDKTNEAASILKQQKLASEWDFIEQQLHDEDFWRFVTLGKPLSDKKIRSEEYPNRIEFFFDLIEQRNNGAAKTDDIYSTFRMYNDWINAIEDDPQKKSTIKCWQEIKNLYYRFHEWYIDRELYHLTGYARLAGISLTTQALLSEADKQKQSELVARIYSEIKSKIFSSGINETINSTAYDSTDVRKILLFSNIALAIQNKHANRFNFDAYLTGSWDIEHIRSQTPEQNKTAWCQAVLEYWGTDSDDNSDDLQNRCWRAVNKNGDNKISADLIQEIQNHFDGLSTNSQDTNQADDSFIDSIGNLCLLDSRTNRGYGNAPFPLKRKTVIHKLSEGVFVPQATQNVFLKVHSSNTSNMMLWNKQDAADYQNHLCESISNLLGEK